MDTRRRSQLAGGLVLLLLGSVLLAAQVSPAFYAWVVANVSWAESWPLIVIGVGFFLFVFGLLVGAPGMAVPACIVGGIGGLLYWQWMTGAWDSWAYAWTLIPGFVGIGIILAGVLEGHVRQALGAGGVTIVISVVLFLVFGSVLGGRAEFSAYWPILLIIGGLALLARRLFR
jgi:hypothetical protein